MVKHIPGPPTYRHLFKGTGPILDAMDYYLEKDRFDKVALSAAIRSQVKIDNQGHWIWHGRTDASGKPAMLWRTHGMPMPVGIRLWRLSNGVPKRCEVLWPKSCPILCINPKHAEVVPMRQLAFNIFRPR